MHDGKIEAKIKPIERVLGTIEVPGDKSVSHRAVMLGSIAGGVTEASNFLTGEDCISTVDAFRKMGVDISVKGTNVKINGVGLRGLKAPHNELYLGNSGTTMRLLSGVLAGQDFESVLTGDDSLSRRPMNRIIVPLEMMGAKISSLKGNGQAPLKIEGGPIKPISFKSKVASAQVKSCILLAGLYATGTTTVEEPFQSRDHMERMLEFFGADIKRNGRITSITQTGKSELKGGKILIPSDISSAAFFIVLALLLKGSELTIKNVGMNPTRIRLLDVLKRMGGDIEIKNMKEYFEPCADLVVKGSDLKATRIEENEIAEIIDEIPIISVLASRAEGVTEIHGVQELRVKETDRIASMSENLRKAGVDITEKDNNLFITGGKGRFKSGEFISYGDHRTAMSMAVAGSISDGECSIHDTSCIDTSFPNFFSILRAIGK